MVNIKLKWNNVRGDTMAEIKVSVIIPIYNMERYLEESMNSVMNQTMKEIEIVCVDDGSTDRSLEILNRYKANNVCIEILIQKNQGSGAARNAGIGVARGEFVAFMDPDDYYAENDVLEYLYNCAKRERVNVCGGG